MAPKLKALLITAVAFGLLLFACVAVDAGDSPRAKVLGVLDCP